MFPPESSAQTAPVPPTLPVSSAATPTRAGALDDELRALEQQRDRLADLLVVDDDELVEQLVEDRHRQLAGVLDGDAVGDRVAVRPACTPTRRTPGPQRAHRDRDAGGEPAAADRDEQRLRVRQLLGELEPDRALAGDHALVLERVDERRAGLLDAASASASASSKVAPARTASAP